MLNFHLLVWLTLFACNATVGQCTDVEAQAQLPPVERVVRGRDLTEPVYIEPCQSQLSAAAYVFHPESVNAVRQSLGTRRLRSRRPFSRRRRSRGRSLLQSGSKSSMPLLDTAGGNFGANRQTALAGNVGGSAFNSGFGSGYQQLFGTSQDSVVGDDPADSSARDSSDASASRTNVKGPSGDESSPNVKWPTGGTGTLVNPITANAEATPYVVAAQTQAGRELVAKAAGEVRQQQRQQQLRGTAPALSAATQRTAKMAATYRQATKGLAGQAPIITAEMAKYALNGGDDDPDLPPQTRLAFRSAGKAAAGAAGAQQPGAAGAARGKAAAPKQQPKAQTGRSQGGAQGYLDEYDYAIQPIKFQGQDSAARDKRSLDLSQYVQTGPFANLIDPSSPDIPSISNLVSDLNEQIKKDKKSGKQSSTEGGLSPEASSDLTTLLRSGYGPVANSIPTAQQLPPGLGDIVGAPSGRGLGYGDYESEDYEGESYPTGVPAFLQSPGGDSPGAGASTGPIFRTNNNGPGPDDNDRPLRPDEPRRRRNTTRGEIAPFCQPPILLCADRDLINFLGTEIDQVRFPDNVLEYNSLRFRLERVVDNLLDQNFSPWGGPTFNLNQVLSLNFRLRETVAALNGLNGIGTNRLALNTLAFDASRPDRWLPDTFSWNSGSLAIDNSFNRVDYVPTYIITGTGPGFATSSINFGPFVDFQVADFRS